MRYVIGFAFCGEKVALIRKNKPAWQAGRLNGIGGKIEPGETGIVAMVREFREETGVQTVTSEWEYKLFMYGDGWEAYVYSVEMDAERFSQIRTIEAEVVEIHAVSAIHREDCIGNIYWMVPMCRDHSGVTFPIRIPFNHQDGTGTPARTKEGAAA